VNLGFLRYDASRDLFDGSRVWSLILLQSPELFVVILVLDDVSYTDKLLVAVRSSDENDVTADDVFGREVGSGRSFGLGSENIV